MSNETETNQINTESDQSNRPDFVAKQYRVIRVEDGWRTRKERIGVAWKSEDGQICFRPSGAQLIEGDIYFYPFNQSEDA